MVRGPGVRVPRSLVGQCRSQGCAAPGANRVVQVEYDEPESEKRAPADQWDRPHENDTRHLLTKLSEAPQA